MKIKTLITALAAALASSAICGCASSGGQAPSTDTCPYKTPQCNKTSQKKLTKDMFYKNGKFDEAAAKQAYFDMMNNLGYPISENLRKNMWVCDFGLNDFPNVGMAGIFWVHDNEKGDGIFGHEIILLPNQMLIEHAHVPHAGLPSKYESWQCRAGRSYCFGEEGEDASKYPDVKVPESQKKFVTVHKGFASPTQKRETSCASTARKPSTTRLPAPKARS